MYAMPARIKISFNVDKLPFLRLRVARIIWAAISVGHIRDQYFNDQVDWLAGQIEDKKPNTFKAFMKLVSRSGLASQYMRKVSKQQHWHAYCPSRPHVLWWRRVWALIQHGDVEIIQVNKAISAD